MLQNVVSELTRQPQQREGFARSRIHCLRPGISSGSGGCLLDLGLWKGSNNSEKATADMYDLKES